MSQSIISSALEFYDSKQQHNKKKFKKVKRYTIEESPFDMERNKITLYDEENKQILTAEYEAIGIYDNNHKIWTWAWSIPWMKKNTTYTSRKILLYGLDLDYKENLFLKTELLTSRFQITDPVQIEIHIAIAAYLSKKTVIYEIKDATDSKNPENYKITYLFLMEEK